MRRKAGVGLTRSRSARLQISRHWRQVIGKTDLQRKRDRGRKQDATRLPPGSSFLSGIKWLETGLLTADTLAQA